MGELLFPLGLIGLGFLLVGLEVAIIPGFGVPGILGVLSLGGGCVLLWQVGGPLLGAVGTFATLGITVAAVIWFARSRAGRSLVLADEIAGSGAPEAALAARRGSSGLAVSTLRPSGVVELGGERYDAVVRDGSFIAAGATVTVVGHEHGQLIVRAAE
jgi:membrane-bound serine protease (ClpP class)